MKKYNWSMSVLCPSSLGSVNETLAIQCGAGLNWPRFTEVVRAALLSPHKALVK